MLAAAANNRSRVLGTSFILFCCSLFLTAYSAKNPEFVRMGYSVISEFIYPLQSLNKVVRDSFSGVWEGYVSLLSVREENEKLGLRVSQLEIENSRLLEFQDENRRLRGLLKISEDVGVKGVAARVIGYDPSNWVQAIIIDRGFKDGVKPGMAVLESEGIVGQIVSTSLSSSRVLLIADHGSGVDAIIQSSRARGVVEGSGSGMAKLRYVLVGEELKEGDRVITSGMDGIYPKGLLIGSISEIKSKSDGLFQAIEVKPSVVFSKLENVLIVTDPVVAQEENASRDAAPGNAR
jgi:rod shape-determining protein MreC